MRDQRHDVSGEHHHHNIAAHTAHSSTGGRASKRRPTAHRHTKASGGRRTVASKAARGHGTSPLDRFIALLNRLWTEYRFETIAVGALILAVAVAIPVIVHTVRSNRETVSEEVKLDDYGDLFLDDTNDSSATGSSGGIRIRVDDKTGEEVEDPTVLAETKAVSDGYLNHCIFLGDSRYVGLVSYAVISDEDVLAQVGIAHTSVEGYTFTQNSGKQYTLKSYLQAKSGDRDVIYIGYGVNGMKGADEDAYEKAYKSLVEHIMEMAPDSRIVLMSIWPVDDNGAYKGSVKNEWVDKYNDFLLALAQYEGIYYLDVNTALKDKNGSINSKYDGGDGLHYNSKGYQVIREYILTHPVPGVPTDGQYTVHYVAPTGQFKDMVKDTVTIPTSAVTPTPEAEHEHEWTEEIIKEAKCTEPGLKRLTCDCGASTEREIPALGHKYGDDGTAEFCSRCGAKNPNYVAKATPTPESKPTPTPVNEPTPTPEPASEPEPTEESTPEPTEESTPEPTEEPASEPAEESAAEAAASTDTSADTAANGE